MKRLILLVLLVAVAWVGTCAAAGGETEEPRTKLESFAAQHGSSIVKRFSGIGSLTGDYGTSLSVDIMQFTNARTGEKTHGITVDVVEGGRLEKSNLSYIDYDEIQSLIDGLVYIAAVDPVDASFDDFEAHYKTLGDFGVTLFSSGQSVSLAVSSGRIGKATAFFGESSLLKLKSLLAQAKGELDAVRS